MAKYSFLLGEYTDEDQIYHFGCRGKCYYITLQDKDDTEKNIYESTNMYEAYDRWKDLKGSGSKNSQKSPRPQGRK